jgi:hypothetical protein
MKNKIRISESELVELIQKILSEQPIMDKKNLGYDMIGKTEEEKSKARKLNYFENIFLPRFQEIKEVHGLEFVIELLNNLAVAVDEVED